MPNKQQDYTPCPTIKESPNRDYSKINEYDNYDPYHGLEIHYLVGLEQDLEEATYVVYLDKKLDVVWCSKNKERKASPGMRAILKRMGFLESMPVKHLEKDRQEEFRKLLGQGLSYYLSCKEDPEGLRNVEQTAFSTFDEAERRINQWNFEYTTRWYASASVAILAGLLVLTVAASAARSSRATWDFTQFGFAGAVGALLFFLVRLRNSTPRQLRVEVSGSKLGYFTTVGVKVLVGMISAVAIGAAMKADLLLGVANKGELLTMPDPFTISAVAFMTCFVAGFSESLVPRFLNAFERTSGLSGEGDRTPQSSGTLHAGNDNHI